MSGQDIIIEQLREELEKAHAASEYQTRRIEHYRTQLDFCERRAEKAERFIATADSEWKARAEKAERERDEVMRLLADRDGWISVLGEHGKALRVWQEWAATLLDEYGRQPLHGQHGDEPAREVISQLVGLAPGVPRCSRCGCFSTRHEVDDEELRECADCECEGYEP